MAIHVMKRDGSIVEFQANKIKEAITKTFVESGKKFSCDNKLMTHILLEIQSFLDESEDDTISVEDIQDIVEDALLDFGYREEAKAYIRYRHEHQLARQKKLDSAMEAKLLARQIDNQNANVDEHSFGGRIGEASSVVMKDYALNHCMSKMARENHLNNEIYIHE